MFNLPNSTYNKTYTNQISPLLNIKIKIKYIYIYEILGPQLQARNQIIQFLKQTNESKLI